MKHLTMLTTALFSLSLLAGCANTPAHQGMPDVRGRILEQSDQGVVVSVGSADAIAIGNELTVYRPVLVGTPKQIPYFMHKATGELRVEQVLSAHSARATLLSGMASKGDVVQRRSDAQPSGSST